MSKLVVLGAGAFIFGAMFVVGIIIMLQIPDRFVAPFPIQAVVGGSIAMFSTLGGFIIGFIQCATQD